MKCRYDGAFSASAYFTQCFEKEIAVSLDGKYITPLLSDGGVGFCLFLFPFFILDRERDRERSLLFMFLPVYFLNCEVINKPTGRDQAFKGWWKGGGFFLFFVFV